MTTTRAFEHEQKCFFQACAGYLPGRGARKAFEDYARAAIEDYCGNCPGCTFAQAAEQIGGKPYEAVQDFLESQPPGNSNGMAGAGRSAQEMHFCRHSGGDLASGWNRGFLP